MRHHRLEDLGAARERHAADEMGCRVSPHPARQECARPASGASSIRLPLGLIASYHERPSWTENAGRARAAQRHGHGANAKIEMGKRKPAKRDVGRAAPAPAEPALAPDDQVSLSNLSLHQLFEQQARQLLDRTDLGEEQKQNILVAMSCPCCGSGAMSYTAKLKR